METGGLGAGAAGARRVAILDLMQRPGDRDAAAILIEHLAGERDERAALLIIRHLERERCRAALPVLWRLYQDRTTAVVIAHAAINAHDAIAADGQ